jgi:hypothetical protein
VNKLLLATAIALGLMMPSASGAADRNERAAASVTGKTVSTRSVRAVNNQTAVACNICFTCGGDWPVFAGSIRSVGDFPIERGSGCAGNPINRNDQSPYLCCR